MKKHRGVEVLHHVFLASALDRGKWSASRPGRFTIGERLTGTHSIGGWLEPRAGLDAMAKEYNICSFRESNPPSSSSSPYLSHYTVRATPAPVISHVAGEKIRRAEHNFRVTENLF
jgi:hypothetical protein